MRERIESRHDQDSIRSSAGRLLDEVRAVYAELGGRSATPRLAPGPWDFALDGIVLELDEENHFNRYRA